MGEGGDDSGFGVTFGVAVFSIIFVMILSLLISGTSPLLTGSFTSGTLNEKAFDSSDYVSMDWWTFWYDENGVRNVDYSINASDSAGFWGTYWNAPDSGSVLGRNIFGGELAWNGWTDADRLCWNDSDGATFVGFHDVKLFALSGGTWIVFHAGGGWDRWWYTITPQEIVNNVEKTSSGSHSSIIHTKLGNVGVSVVFQFAPGADVADDLATNGYYNVAVGQMPIDNTAAANTDIWTVVGQVLTFSLPSTGVWWIGTIVSGTVWTGLIMAGFYLINRLLDHIPFT